MIIMIIKNGLVVDPALGLSEKMDLAIENGTLLKIEKNIDTTDINELLLYIIDKGKMQKSSVEHTR